MSTTPALVSALRELGDRPAVVADGRAISGIGLLLGVSPPGGLPRVLAQRVAAHAALPPSAARTAEQRLQHWAGVLGPPPIRHTVLHPATDLAVELALATLLAGGTVHCGDPQQDPDQQLAALAADATTHLSLPSALLWRLSRRPGLAAHDLGALRLVLHVGPEPQQEDVYAAVDALGAVLAHVRAPHTHAEAADHRLRAAVDAASATAWKHTIGVTADQVQAFGAHLDQAVLASLLLTLQQSGVLTDPGRGHTEAEVLAAALVTPAQRTRVGRWLDALTRHGLITRHEGVHHGRTELAAAEVREAWRPAVEAWTDGLGPLAALDRVRRGALRLPRLITGEEAPRPAATPIRWTAARGYLGAALGALVRGLAETHHGPVPLRVLELGHDGADSAITRALATRPRQHADHHHLPDGGRYDIVVATATGRPDRAVQELVDQLAPGGHLLLLAPTGEQLDLLITGEAEAEADVLPALACIATAVRACPVPPAPPASPISATSPASPMSPASTAFAAEHWRAALTAAGCPTVLALPEDGHPMGLLGQRLFAARIP
ncbi:hypothetical protein ACIOJE_17665 [Kitasatospora sp. NPDC087861]|uniref:hypothetical protein n=1 Tax=Kitasatospora sp. NPDC087861 TaxID=3364070 RepID=UPI0037F51CF4